MLITATQTEHWERYDAAYSSSLFTSVQHLETNDFALELQTKCQALLHAPFTAERGAIFAALASDPLGGFEKRLTRIQHCCQFPVIYVDSTGKPSTSLGRCRDRLCPLCSAARARESGERVKAIVQLMDAPRFMTLTVPHCDDSLEHQLDTLMVLFRALRAEPEWKHFVKGGVWSLELTYNRDRSEWHPHIHIIFDGGYFPQPRLKAIWSRIQQEEVIVDVRAVSSVGAAAKYIAKYVSKTVDLNSWGPEEIRTYASAMHRRRTIHTFGSCHGRTAEADPDDEPTHTATQTVGVWVLRRRIRLGDEQARRAALTLASTGGVFRRLLGDCCGGVGWLEGERLKSALKETAEWLLELKPETAAMWRPDPPAKPPPKPPPKPDPALGDPDWISVDSWNEGRMKA